MDTIASIIFRSNLITITLNKPPSLIIYQINTGIPYRAYTIVSIFPPTVIGTISPYPVKIQLKESRKLSLKSTVDKIFSYIRLLQPKCINI